MSFPTSVNSQITDSVTQANPIPKWYKSKKFWYAVCGYGAMVATALIMKYFGQDAKWILTIVGPGAGLVSTLIFGQSFVDGKVYSASVQASADVLAKAVVASIQSANSTEQELKTVATALASSIKSSPSEGKPITPQNP
jgi:hypothetical protein